MIIESIRMFDIGENNLTSTNRRDFQKQSNRWNELSDLKCYIFIQQI